MTELERELAKALREILEAGTREELDDEGEPRSWEQYLLYHDDISRYWKLLERVEA